jgi:hypothetical protein
MVHQRIPFEQRLLHSIFAVFVEVATLHVHVPGPASVALGALPTTNAAGAACPAHALDGGFATSTTIIELEEAQ